MNSLPSVVREKLITQLLCFTQVSWASSGCKGYLGVNATDFLGIELYCSFRTKRLWWTKSVCPDSHQNSQMCRKKYGCWDLADDLIAGTEVNCVGKQEMREHVNLFIRTTKWNPTVRVSPGTQQMGLGEAQIKLSWKSFPLSPVLAPFCASNHKDLVFLL